MTDDRVPPHDPQLGGRLRPALMAIPAVLWSILEAGFLATLAVVWPRAFAPIRTKLIRAWGSVCLKLLGIRLEVHGREHLEVPGALVMFNHVSLLDLHVLASLWPEKAAVVYKQEFHKIPGVGHALRYTGMVAINRSDPVAARQSLDDAVKVLTDEQRPVLVAPEGTRSRVGGLLPFKMGPFHMAAGSHAPIVPFIMRGLETIMPMGKLIPHTGVVRVDILPPIDTSAWRRSRVHKHADELRDLYLRYVDPAPGTTPEELAAQRAAEKAARREAARSGDAA